MNRNFLSVALALSILLSSLASSQTISSKSTGGNWTDPNTWIGGVVPTANNDVVINGTVIVQTSTCRNLTISSGAILQAGTPGYCCYEYLLTVTGSVTNNGVTQNSPDGNWLTMKVSGNITNNGTWKHSRTELAGAAEQSLSLTQGRVFEGSWKVTGSSGTLAASAALGFRGDFDLGGSILDMKNFSLTLSSAAATVFNGRVINTADLVGRGSPTLFNITYEGNPNLKGVFLAREATVKGTLTIVDTLQGWSPGFCCYEYTLKVTGNVINNGLIRNSPDGNWLALNITGNIANNGSWLHRWTRLSGSADQYLTTAQNKTFDGSFTVTDSVGAIVASSALMFSGDFDLNSGVLDMRNNSLTLSSGSAAISNGRVINTADLIGRGSPTLFNITYEGNPNLKGLFLAREATVQGTLTIVDTLQSWSPGYCCYEYTLKVRGNVINNGVIRNSPSGNWLALHASGDVTNNATWTSSYLLLTGSGSRTIDGRKMSTTVRSTGSKVSLAGKNFLPNLSIDGTSYCTLSAGGTLEAESQAVDAKLDNHGMVTIAKEITTTQDYPFFATTARILTGSGIDTLNVQSFGHQVPTSFANAVKAWWRLVASPRTAQSSLSWLQLNYQDSELGTNVEANLQVYRSLDSGLTWTQVSTSENVTRNASANTLTIADVPCFGDYLLSSSPDPVSVRPSIAVSIIGRSQIRIGAPNRYTIQYTNNSDGPTEDFLLSVNTGNRVHIQKVELFRPNASPEIIPKDSLVFEGYEGDDSTLVLYCAGMGPREERKFDIVVTADNVLGKRDMALFEPISITAGTVLVWAGKAAVVYAATKAIDYLGDRARDALELTPEQKRQWESSVAPIPEELKQAEKGKGEWVMRKVGAKIIQKTMNITGGTLKSVQTIGRNIWKIGPNLRRKMWYWLYKETGLYGVDEEVDGTSYSTEVSGGTNKRPQPVTSWDPNEKEGPSGYGAQGFVSSLGRTTYRILFENKKEASAPAWKIVIVDTLRPEFETTSVEFGNTSHDTSEAKWIMTRAGNILRWEIEGIELPPNKVPPEGEGYVLFSVAPKTGLPSGTSLRNSATITFDLNKPITTNEVVNTLDFESPVTTMQPLPSSTSKSPMMVRWESSDGQNGAGVQMVTVYASKDNGPFFAVGTSASDSLAVPITNGQHRFYALAVDYVGNAETVRPSLVQTTAANVVSVEENSLPYQFSLSQNYPNPFNPATTIGFSLAASSRATLKIFDILGREVARLLDEERRAGRHTVEWEARMLSSGVYFYRLEAHPTNGHGGNFVETKKLLLLR